MPRTPSLGQRVRRVIADAGLTQAEVAARVRGTFPGSGLHATTVSRLCRRAIDPALAQDPRLRQTLRRIAVVCGRDPDYFTPLVPEPLPEADAPLGTRIQHARLARNWSQADLARAVRAYLSVHGALLAPPRFSQATVSRVEAEPGHRLRADLEMAVCRVLAIPLPADVQDPADAAG